MALVEWARMMPKIDSVFWPIVALLVPLAVVLAIVIPLIIAQDDECLARGGVPVNGRNFHVCLDPGALR